MNKLLTDRVRLLRAMEQSLYISSLNSKERTFLSTAIKKIRVDTMGYYLSLSWEKEGHISFDAKQKKLTNNINRTRTTLSKFLRKRMDICKELTISDRDLELYTQEVFGLIFNSNINFQRLKGNSIIKLNPSIPL